MSRHLHTFHLNYRPKELMTRWYTLCFKCLLILAQMCTQCTQNLRSESLLGEEVSMQQLSV